MFSRKADNASIEKMLEAVDALNGSEDIKKLLQNFIKYKLLGANSLILIWTYGKHVGVDATKMSEPESVWAFEKAKHELLHKGLSLND